MIQNTDTGYMIQDIWIWYRIQTIQITGYRIYDTEYRAQETGYRKQDKDIDTKYRIQNTRYRLHGTGYLNRMQWVQWAWVNSMRIFLHICT